LTFLILAHRKLNKTLKKQKQNRKQKKTKTSLQTLFLLLSLFLSNLLRRVSLSVYSLLILVAFSYFSLSIHKVCFSFSFYSKYSTVCLCLAFGQLIFLINFVCLLLSVFPFFFFALRTHKDERVREKKFKLKIYAFCHCMPFLLWEPPKLPSHRQPDTIFRHRCCYCSNGQKLFQFFIQILIIIWDEKILMDILGWHSNYFKFS
jgi:hypothetical protein